MAEEVGLDQLNFLHPKLLPYVKVLLSHEFGLLRDTPKIHSIECGSIIRKNDILYGDRFQLIICYCRKPLNWHVLMNGNDITKAPDFIMEENFLAYATPEMIRTTVPSLANWCPTNVRCLLNVVLELFQLYKSYQVNLLRRNPSLQRYLFEYDTLLSMAGISENNVEVCVQSRNPVVIFSIHLNVDFSKLPTALPNSKDLAVLVVEFKDNAKNAIQLNYRYELDDILDRPLELPDLPPDMSLMDYVPELENLLQKKVEKIINQVHERKMLYSNLVMFLEPSLINGDNIHFRSISFLLEVEGYYFVLSVNIPLEYPETRPDLHFLPIQKATTLEYRRIGIETWETDGFAYNQNMSHEEIALNILKFVRDTAIREIKMQ